MTEDTRQNFYNSQQQLVRPTGSAHRITPNQARMLDQAVQPIQIPLAPTGQSSETQIDVSAMFQPLPITEQYSPQARASGVVIRALPFLIGALALDTAGVVYMGLGFVMWLGWGAILIMIVFAFVNAQENSHSAVGVALKHEENAQKALQTIVASNERVTLAKLENEDKAHEREINLRSKVLDGFLDKLGGIN